MKQFFLVCGVFVLMPVAYGQERPRVDCPDENITDRFATQECTSLINNTELGVPGLFENEIERYRTELSSLWGDRGSDPVFIAQAGVYDLRNHRECLVEVCRSYFNICDTARATQALSQSEWCDTQIEQIFEIEQYFFAQYAGLNQAQKEDDLYAEKMHGMWRNIKEKIHDGVGIILRSLDTIKKTLSGLIQNPIN